MTSLSPILHLKNGDCSLSATKVVYQMAFTSFSSVSLRIRDFRPELTKSSVWANNPSFPPESGIQPGFDPIIGQTTTGGSRTMTGAFAGNTTRPLNLLAQWVNSKGGEYFFSPSIPALKDTFATAANATS
jgi:hypothetical protein